MKKKAVKSLRK
jgi:hypothetical protein